MNVLFVHPDYPAQFRHIAGRLAQRGHRVLFLCGNIREEAPPIPGVEKIFYKAAPGPQGFLSVLHDMGNHGEGSARACVELLRRGFAPDLVYAASGWGGSWFMRDLFPKARLAAHFEWYHNPDSISARFLGAEPDLGRRVGMRLRNTVIINDVLTCDLCIVPTHWQKSRFPPDLRNKLTVLHDGIDTNFFAPSDEPPDIPDLPLLGDEPVITYAAEGLEPARGFPEFMKAMGIVLSRRLKAHVVIAGEAEARYSAPRADGNTWKDYMLSQVALPKGRVHFVGALPPEQYRLLLRRSSVHVCLTAPLALSWSLLESMSCGCLIVGSDTPPVREFIRHEENGLLCDFFDTRALAAAVLRALDAREQLRRLRERARRDIVEHYALDSILPKLERLLLGGGAAIVPLSSGSVRETPAAATQESAHDPDGEPEQWRAVGLPAQWREFIRRAHEKRRLAREEQGHDAP